MNYEVSKTVNEVTHYLNEHNYLGFNLNKYFEIYFNTNSKLKNIYGNEIPTSLKIALFRVSMMIILIYFNDAFAV